jgi:hypothetical protein
MMTPLGHPTWKNLPKRQEAVPKWWSDMIPCFQLDATKFANQYQGEEVVLSTCYSLDLVTRQ